MYMCCFHHRYYTSINKRIGKKRRNTFCFVGKLIFCPTTTKKYHQDIQDSINGLINVIVEFYHNDDDDSILFSFEQSKKKPFGSILNESPGWMDGKNRK